MTAVPHSLLDAPIGRLVRVRTLGEAANGLAPEGIHEGGAVTVERRIGLGGPLIVKIGETRLALARSVARTVGIDGGPEDR